MERGFRTDNLSTRECQHLLRAGVALALDVPFSGMVEDMREGRNSDLEVAKRVLSGS